MFITRWYLNEYNSHEFYILSLYKTYNFVGVISDTKLDLYTTYMSIQIKLSKIIYILKKVVY